MMLIKVILMSILSVTTAQADIVTTTKKEDGSVEFINVKKAAGTLLTDDKQLADRVIYQSSPGNVVTFSDKRPIENYAILRFDCYACDPLSTVNWQGIELNITSYRQFIRHSSAKYSVDAALVRAIIHAESSFNSAAISRVGAQGLMQLMPATANELAVYNVFDAQQNIEGGVKYLAKLLKTFNGNIKLATAAYNAGPNAVKKYKGIPPYKETQAYVERVGVLHRRYKLALRH